MAIKYNPLKDGFWYTVQDERGVENPFKVKLQTIPSQDLVKLQDGLLQRSVDDKISLRNGSYTVAVCKASIIDWSGLLDENDAPIVCKTDYNGVIHDDCLRMIPASFFEEIANVASSVSQDPSTLQLFVDEE